MFRDLIPLLADRYHVVAPDLPGFGFSGAPDAAGVHAIRFDNLAKVDRRASSRRSASSALRSTSSTMARRSAFASLWRIPSAITAIISQNGNAYEEGLSEGWNPIQRYWQDPTPANRAALREFLTPEATKWQYTHGVADEMRGGAGVLRRSTARCWRGPATTRSSSTSSSTTPATSRSIPSSRPISPRSQPPLLAVWGKNDPFFLPPGAEAFTRDNPNAEVHFFDTGHFALETHVAEIATAIRDFLGRTLSAGKRTAA